MQPSTHKTESSFTDLHTYYLLPHQPYTYILKLRNSNIYNLQSHNNNISHIHLQPQIPRLSAKGQIVNVRTRKISLRYFNFILFMNKIKYQSIIN